jgi:hypothetical protein
MPPKRKSTKPKVVAAAARSKKIPALNFTEDEVDLAVHNLATIGPPPPPPPPAGRSHRKKSASRSKSPARSRSPGRGRSRSPAVKSRKAARKKSPSARSRSPAAKKSRKSARSRSRSRSRSPSVREVKKTVTQAKPRGTGKRKERLVVQEKNGTGRTRGVCEITLFP